MEAKTARCDVGEFLDTPEEMAAYLVAFFRNQTAMLTLLSSPCEILHVLRE